MQLIEPNENLKNEFSIFITDIRNNDPDRYFIYTDAEINLSKYINSLSEQRKGKNLPQGYSPCSHFWLIDNSNNILGALRVRHNINSKYLAEELGHIGYDIAPKYRKNGFGTLMLQLGLLEARKLNIKEILITADENNVASRKVIEKNGGEYESTRFGKTSGINIARYWSRA
ncbi:GNAT family N-acetyltransferase [Endozoicomonas euniceicola]|uniref:GNAT family N-acetyltransferase n=1 Tax=Endozoicomonas euniceicola TaxID=1234143 RepID=A0ABY6GPN2_9GAMM|nr:GNAT family N-acetyltransferase [Endozoicomonas euniceicola]UYM14068.1 GNAT family N-acetyltransferase [Endozoicomonas euniceicola]